MGKGKSIQQALLGNLDSCMQSNETRTHPHTMHKNKRQMAERHNKNTVKIMLFTQVIIFLLNVLKS